MSTRKIRNELRNKNLKKLDNPNFYFGNKKEVEKMMKNLSHDSNEKTSYFTRRSSKGRDTHNMRKNVYTVDKGKDSTRRIISTLGKKISKKKYNSENPNVTIIKTNKWTISSGENRIVFPGERFLTTESNINGRKSRVHFAKPRYLEKFNATSEKDISGGHIRTVKVSKNRYNIHGNISVE